LDARERRSLRKTFLCPNPSLSPAQRPPTSDRRLSPLAPRPHPPAAQASRPSVALFLPAHTRWPCSTDATEPRHHTTTDHASSISCTHTSHSMRRPSPKPLAYPARPRARDASMPTSAPRTRTTFPHTHASYRAAPHPHLHNIACPMPCHPCLAPLPTVVTTTRTRSHALELKPQPFRPKQCTTDTTDLTPGISLQHRPNAPPRLPNSLRSSPPYTETTSSV
jgi:hypothetical protein